MMGIEYGYGLLCKVAGIDFFAVKPIFSDPATQIFIVSVKDIKVIIGRQMQMKIWILKCLQHMPLHMNP